MKNEKNFKIKPSTKYHWKGLEKCSSMMLFSKTSTETLPLKKPKNLKINPKTWYVNEKFSNKNDILYIVEKLLKSSNQ